MKEKPSGRAFNIPQVEFSQDLAKIMKSVVGYRNVLVHEYLRVNRHLTYKYIQEELLDLSNFAKEIEKFLEKFSHKGKSS